MDANSIINKIAAGLKKVGAPVRAVYKRKVVLTGGEKAQLLGRASKTVQPDVLLDPQPRYSPLGQKASIMVAPSGKSYMATDLEMLVLPTAMTADELRDKNTTIVMRDANNGEETFEVLFVDDTAAINGTTLLNIAIIRSKSR